RLRSPVTRTVKPAASAASSSSPFFNPAQDCCWTVRTSCPRNRSASCRGSCSSSRTRTRSHRFVGCFQSSNGLLPRHGWKRIKELLEAVIAFEIVDQVSEGNARADEHRRPTQDLRVAVNDGQTPGHVDLSLNCTTSCR